MSLVALMVGLTAPVVLLGQGGVGAQGLETQNASQRRGRAAKRPSPGGRGACGAMPVV